MDLKVKAYKSKKNRVSKVRCLKRNHKLIRNKAMQYTNCVIQKENRKIKNFRVDFLAGISQC